MNKIKNKLSEKYNIETTQMAMFADLKTDNNTINLSLGDLDIITPKEIINYAFNAANNGYTKYTKINGIDELINNIKNHYSSHYKTHYNENEIITTSSGCFALYSIFNVLLNPLDEVILPSPYFTPYISQIQSCGGKAVILDTTKEVDFNLNIEILKSLITNKTKCILINSPNNPTGAIIPHDTLKEVYKIAKENDILIISDEVYEGFIYENNFTHLGTIDKDITITISSFSKNFAMTGWRIGYILANSSIIDAVKIFLENTTYSVNSISQMAASYAIKNYDYIVPIISSTFKNRIDYSYTRLSSMNGINISKPKGSIYLFPNISTTKMSSLTFSKFLFDKANIIVVPGTAFGLSGEGFIRMAATVQESELKIAFDRMESLLSSMNF